MVWIINRIFHDFPESGVVVSDTIKDNETTAGNVITLGTPDVVAGVGNTISPNSIPPPPPYGPSNTSQTYIQVNYIYIYRILVTGDKKGSMRIQRIWNLGEQN